MKYAIGLTFSVLHSLTKVSVPSPPVKDRTYQRCLCSDASEKHSCHPHPVDRNSTQLLSTVLRRCLFRHRTAFVQAVTLLVHLDRDEAPTTVRNDILVSTHPTRAVVVAVHHGRFATGEAEAALEVRADRGNHKWPEVPCCLPPYSKRLGRSKPPIVRPKPSYLGVYRSRHRRRSRMCINPTIVLTAVRHHTLWRTATSHAALAIPR